MRELIIRVSRAGIRKVSADVATASQASEAGRLSAALAIPLSLFDRLAREFGDEESKRVDIHRG